MPFLGFPETSCGLPDVSIWTAGDLQGLSLKLVFEGQLLQDDEKPLGAWARLWAVHKGAPPTESISVLESVPLLGDLKGSQKENKVPFLLFFCSERVSFALTTRKECHSFGNGERSLEHPQSQVPARTGLWKQRNRVPSK